EIFRAMGPLILIALGFAVASRAAGMAPFSVVNTFS
ncbi:hypothetical protein Q604_UNBC11056G0002, partial [human gut metagenome]